jgi:hypothetical protein
LTWVVPLVVTEPVSAALDSPPQAARAVARASASVVTAAVRPVN